MVAVILVSLTSLLPASCYAWAGPGHLVASGPGCTVWAMPGSAAPAPKSPSPRLWRMRRVQVAGTAAAAALAAGIGCALAVGAPGGDIAVALGRGGRVGA